MELKVCPNPCASASAAEFNVLPARRESSSKALFEPLETLKYCWVFPLSCCLSTLRSRRRLLVRSDGGSQPQHRWQPSISLPNTTPSPPSPGRNPISLKQVNARAFSKCYFKDCISATER